MFHSSESIIITSDKTKSKSILSNALRQRASTWSASEDNLKPKFKAAGKPFHKRQPSNSSQNSNSKLSIHSLDRDYHSYKLDSHPNANGLSVASGRQSRSSQNTPVSSTRWAFPLGMPTTPNSYDANSATASNSLRMSPPEVEGVSREGLDQWLGDNNSPRHLRGAADEHDNERKSNIAIVRSTDDIARLSIPTVCVDDLRSADGQLSEQSESHPHSGVMGPYDSITPRASGRGVFKLSRPLSMKSGSGSMPEFGGWDEGEDAKQGGDEIEVGVGVDGHCEIPVQYRELNHNEDHYGEDIFPPNINIASGPALLHFNRGYTATDESTNFFDMNDDYTYDDGMSIPQSQDTFDTPTSRSSCVRFMDEVEAQVGPTPASYKRRPPASLVMDDGEYREHGRLGLGYCTPDGIGLEPRELHDIEDPHDKLMSHMNSNPSLAVDGDNQVSKLALGNFEEYKRSGEILGSSALHLQSSSSLRLSKTDTVDSTGTFRQNDGAVQNLFDNWWCFPHAPKPSWSRVSSAVVRHAPCFWCCFRPSKMGGTDRDTLIKLNYLCATIALWQFGVGIFILIIFLSNDIVERNLDEGVPYRQYYKEALTPNLWMMSGSLLVLSFVGFVLFVTTVFTIPVIRRVNLVGAIKYMWVLYWVLPLQIFLVIALFDYHNVTDVWIKHWWGNPSMAWFRSFFCDFGTANTKCAVPYMGGANYTSEESWCREKYDNSRDCEDIRASAITKMSQGSYFFFYLNAIIGGALVVLLLLSLGLLEGIISAPIVQRSKETNIPLWLTLPILGCLVSGVVLLFSPQSLLSNESGSSIYWIGVCYFLSMATFTVSALLGWFISAKTVLNTRDKKQKEIAIFIFIVMMCFTIIAVGAIFTASLVYSLDIVRVSLKDDRRGTIACYVDATSSCTNCECPALSAESGLDCHSDTPRCPEWTSQDVSRIVQTQLKQSATLAAIFFIYAFSALRFGLDLRRSQSKYQIAYV